MNIYDLVIIGSGPAGLAAAVYAQRACLNTVVIEKTGMSGGQILTTTEVDNYPGLPGIGGFDLGIKMREHADHLGGQFMTGEVVKINASAPVHEIILADGTSLKTRTMIIATGASHRHLGVPGEEAFIGKGVSYCATCDGAFFRNRTAAVIGGGDVAVEDAIFLARLCEKVYIVHRRDSFRAARVLSDRLLSLENVVPVLNSTTVSIDGKDKVESLTVHHLDTDTDETLKTDGVFIAVGMLPNAQAYKDVVATDKTGYIIADETCQTNVPGIFSAGDILTKQLRQVVSAASDGANAVYSVQRYLEGGHA